MVTASIVTEFFIYPSPQRFFAGAAQHLFIRHPHILSFFDLFKYPVPRNVCNRFYPELNGKIPAAGAFGAHICGVKKICESGKILKS
jgi:hypothetical protein